MKRILLILTLMVCMGFGGAECAFADAESPRITEVYALNGKLHYCDTPTSRVVLTGVSPVFPGEAAAAMAREAEYLEIRISPDCMRMNDGSVITLEYLNMYADSDVWFIATRDENGNLMIPYLRFI